ncbi:MAG: hypothetical protein RMK20_15210 [Verrucomicrobiales bacterium]|nr:hypothetical protein [Verrucomicrobiales bacterium]
MRDHAPGETRVEVLAISTGALTLDLAIGAGGRPAGALPRFGPESSGKTTPVCTSSPTLKGGGPPPSSTPSTRRPPMRAKLA